MSANNKITPSNSLKSALEELGFTESKKTKSDKNKSQKKKTKNIQKIKSTKKKRKPKKKKTSFKSKVKKKSILREEDNYIVDMHGNIRKVGPVDAQSNIKKTTSSNPVNKDTSENKKENLLLQESSQLNPLLVKNDATLNYEPVYISEHEILRWNKSTNEIIPVIGLDFGTAYTKVVVQEPDSEQAWSIPFNSSLSDQYLIPSAIGIQDNIYSLKTALDFVQNLKIKLLKSEWDDDIFFHCIAFLTFIVKHSKDWVLKNKYDQLSGAKLLWTVNMGLPAKNMENKKLVKKYKVVLLTALILSDTNVSLSISNIKNIYLKTKNAVNSNYETLICNNTEYYLEQVNIIPELLAQIKGYLRSELWDRNKPKFMLVDIGGGTVDSAIVNVVPDDVDDNVSILDSSVNFTGAIELHNTRLKWHQKHIESGHPVYNSINQLVQKQKFPNKIPNAVSDYIQPAEYQNIKIDNEFYKKYSNPLSKNIRRAKDVDPNSEQWTDLPFLLCGGGKKIQVYRKFIRMINRNINFKDHLREIHMPVPKNLLAPGLNTNDYNRISVAYGLSFRNDGVIYKPYQISKIQSNRKQYLKEDHYVGPEQT